MSFNNERLAIEDRFEEHWKDTSIAWPNVAFDMPNNEDWVKITILNGSSSYRAINNSKRHTGIIVVQLFTPIDSGTSIIRKHADTVVSIFDGKQFSDVVCDVASIETVGTNDIWHQVNVTIPYWRD